MGSDQGLQERDDSQPVRAGSVKREEKTAWRRHAAVRENCSNGVERADTDGWLRCEERRKRQRQDKLEGVDLSQQESARRPGAIYLQLGAWGRGLFSFLSWSARRSACPEWTKTPGTGMTGPAPRRVLPAFFHSLSSAPQVLYQGRRCGSREQSRKHLRIPAHYASESMDSPLDPAREETPYSSPFASSDRRLASPLSIVPDPSIDPVVALTARRLADVINGFKRNIDRGDGGWTHAERILEPSLKVDHSQTYELLIVPDADGAEYPVTMQARVKKTMVAASGPAKMNGSNTAASASSNCGSRLYAEERTRNRVHADDKIGNAASSLTKADLDELFLKLRDDVQEDTSECVNHVHRPLRRFKQEWYDKNARDDKQTAIRHLGGAFRDSIFNNGLAPPGISLSPGIDKGD
ncbi:hypothetical protein CC78DRAFT_603785 [Lojkania enalia]|uniref:Uncharacterized protein n=1 Tax=Lojkania enalia TaxID=147567 RepID=A0A9P4K973_9PLEO|nr:hypothetical protein CC78DRAFT_603785 [Didymosphaeria enalia]